MVGERNVDLLVVVLPKHVAVEVNGQPVQVEAEAEFPEKFHVKVEVEILAHDETCVEEEPTLLAVEEDAI